MNLHITGHHVHVTPAIREYLSSKIERVNRHFDHVIDAHVILSVAKLRQKVEATLHVRGRDIFCESTAQDMYAAIDALIDKLDRTIIKHKEKHLGARHADAPLRQRGALLDGQEKQ
ncbi:MAG: ribosome-associated translation inhibitor RaiA [Betaproteobacteria bacterium]|nr:ribosome-associated translation inhibitor RaiA [Betaproteobacteria bacterium]